MNEELIAELAGDGMEQDAARIAAAHLEATVLPAFAAAWDRKAAWSRRQVEIRQKAIAAGLPVSGYDQRAARPQQPAPAAGAAPLLRPSRLTDDLFKKE